MSILDRIVSRRQALTIALFAVVVSVAALPYYSFISLWIGVVMAMMLVVTGLMVISGPSFPPFPHVALLFAGLQLVIMCWFACYYPPADHSYDIGERTPAYLAYGAPACLSYCFGWTILLFKLRKSKGPGRAISQQFRNDDLFIEFDTLLLAGGTFLVLGHIINVPTLGFGLILLANLRFVGGFAWMLSARRGWKWRIGPLIGIELVASASSGMFGNLALWGGCFLALLLYRHKPKTRTIAVAMIAMGLALPSLEHAKLRVREITWIGDIDSSHVFGFSIPWRGINKPVLCGLYIVEGVWKIITFQFDETDLQHLSARYNHGWIVNRIMLHVPSSEPYAHGETLITALKAALIPRLLSPTKYRAGGEMFERFTGHSLANPSTGERTTSMNIGFAGEFYANFGLQGGILASGIYGFCCAMLFHWFYRRSQNSLLWWAFFPYVFLWGMKPEEGLSEALNWTVKASLMAAFVYFCFPAIRAELSRKVASRRLTEAGAGYAIAGLRPRHRTGRHPPGGRRRSSTQPPQTARRAIDP